MIEMDGKYVFSELGEIVDPRHTALVLIDMQRDFIEPDGVFGRLGADLSMYPPMRSRLVSLLASARMRGVTVIHIQMSSLANLASDSPAQLRFNLRMHESLHLRHTTLRYAEIGTEGHRFVEELTPAEGELVVPKWRSSGFWGTNLDMLLRSNGIKSVVVTGCTTEGCVESTARDALFNDYYVVVADDCVASDDPAQHEASLFLMRHRFDIASSDEIVQLWESAEPHVKPEITASLEGARQMSPTSP